MLGDEERSAVDQVLRGATLTHGPRVKEFEAALAEFTGAPHAIAVATCAASLHLACLALELGPGDEVLVPAQTHVAMAHAVEACGARPVFWDCELETGNVDLALLGGLVTDRTRAISVVHYLGRPVDMDPIVAFARMRRLVVVEDCAIALGATYRGAHVGLHGDIGCFSFYPVKHITTGEGGAVLTRDAELARRISSQRAFGIDRHVVAERRHGGSYDVEYLGLNYRMGEVQAALGIVQLERLPDFLAVRERNFEALRSALDRVPGVRVLDSGHGSHARSSHYCLVAVLDDELVPRRRDIVERMQERGVGTSVYYPRALPDLTYYSRRYGGAGSCPNASRISDGSIALPIGPHVEEKGIETIASALAGAVEAVAAHV